MCGSGYLTYPKFLPPTLNFFLQILKIILFCYCLPTSEFDKKIYQNDHLKWKSKFLCIQSLVLEVEVLKQG